MGILLHNLGKSVDFCKSFGNYLTIATTVERKHAPLHHQVYTPTKKKCEQEHQETRAKNVRGVLFIIAKNWKHHHVIGDSLNSTC